MDKPTDVKTAGALLLAGGIWSCIMAMTVMLASFFLCFPCYMYGFAAGIYAIVKGTALLNNDCYGAGVPRLAAMLQIGQIIDFDVVGMGLGVGALILLDDAKVKAYLEGTGPAQAAAPAAHVAHARADAAPAPDPAVAAVEAVEAARRPEASAPSVEPSAVAQAAWETPGWGGGAAPAPRVPPAWGGGEGDASKAGPSAPSAAAFSVAPVATAAPVVVESLTSGSLPVVGGEGSPWGSAPNSARLAEQASQDAAGGWSDWSGGASGAGSGGSGDAEGGTGYKVAPWGQPAWAEFDTPGVRAGKDAAPAEVGVPAGGRKRGRG